MQTQTGKRGRLTRILSIGALAVLILTVVITFLSLSYFETDPKGQLASLAEDPLELPTEPPAETAPPETEPPVTEPPLLDLPLNPYGDLDFQYEGRYLKCLRTETVTGIDVSAHQQEIDWAKVAASGVDFAMVRVGYRGYESGKLVVDPYAEANLVGAAEAGLETGVYFFSQALNVEEALEEAAFLLEAIADYEITMPVVFDWETVHDESARSKEMDPRTLTDCALAFLGAVEEAGYTPMIYFNTYQSRNLLYLEELKDYEFWLAMYTSRMDFPYAVKMWQYTDTGRVPGISGNADINVYFPEVG
ncbi:MAG: glycoside hydrolase family 25 protein [Oscillospiraceae bacterium]|nr:glycoside hydrolase family 25 protein [Oscillospiraceae bacterium]MBQ7802243.1 glycoside hydrolase family 25 protein [Oscillospiraceae bacterium]